MSASELKGVLLRVFLRLRRLGHPLGVGELLTALRALEGGWGTGGPEDLKQIVRLLWWHSPAADEFDAVWAAALGPPPAAPGAEEDDALTVPLTGGTVRPGDGAGVVPPGAPGPRCGVPDAAAWAALPLRVPTHYPAGEEPAELRGHGPVSRRHMAYTWRYLRRPVPYGPADELDVPATVGRAARQGFYLAPVYRRGRRNAAHLALLIDQGGSMAPFHRFTRDLVETACAGERLFRRVDVYYFHNVPPASVYRDPHLTEPLAWDRASRDWTADTSVLVVSDAGAARGHRRLDRIRASGAFLAGLKRRTALLAWLNPMPEERWGGTSAQVIAHLVPMFPMDPDGFGSALNVLRGQAPPRGR